MMEFVQSLNPLYAFPIVAVIICMFIVYTFGFKSPEQPPSFRGVEDDNKASKKRKIKDTTKRDRGRVSQNGKLNGSNKSKPQISPGKKKVIKTVSADNAPTEKTYIERTVTKFVKLQSENKTTSEKKKTVTMEDTCEDGWVQLISKKARKSRKDEAACKENRTILVNPFKHFEGAKSEEISAYEESPEKSKGIYLENLVLKKKQLSLKKVTQDINDSKVIDSCENQEKVLHYIKSDTENLENICNESALKNRRPIENAMNQSRKKKKDSEIVDTNIEITSSIPDQSPAHVISELSFLNTSVESPVAFETLSTHDKDEGNQLKESKSSNVVFDELEGLYPQVKDLRKKKKVRREH